MVEIAEVHKGSGAALQHIAKGDRLLAVDGLPVRGMALNAIQQLLVGAATSTVRLQLERPKGGEFVCEVQRVPISPKSKGLRFGMGFLSLSGRH